MILIDTATCFCFAHFKHANSYIRNVLFHKYCTAFYDSQMLPMLGDKCKCTFLDMVEFKTIIDVLYTN